MGSSCHLSSQGVRNDDSCITRNQVILSGQVDLVGPVLEYTKRGLQFAIKLSS